MKFRLLLLTALATFGFAIAAMAQVVVTISANGSTTICSGDSVQLNSVVSPIGVYQYQWVENGINITGANSASYATSTSGAYMLRVTDLSSNVYYSNAISVSVNPLPVTPSVTYNSPAIICNGDSVILYDSLSTNVSYQWYFNSSVISNANFSNYTASASGIYKLIVSDLTTGCSNISQEIVVGEIPRIASDTIHTCGDSILIDLTNSNFSYSTLPVSCNVNMSGASIVSTTVVGSGGSQSIIICYGGNYTNGGGSNIYVVEYGGTLNGFGGSGGCTAYVKEGGIYNYISGGGGGNIVYYEPGAIINAGGTQIVQCNSIGVIYPSNTSTLCNNLTYQWSNGATTPTITVNPSIPTTFLVTVSNGSISCSDQVLVIPSDVAIDSFLGQDTLISPFQICNYSITPIPGAAYSWQVINGNIISGQGTNAVSIQWGNSSQGSIHLVVSNGSCADSMSVTVHILSTSLSDFSDSFNNPYFSIENNAIYFRGNNIASRQAHYRLLSPYGAVINFGEVSYGMINLSNLPNGIYILCIQEGISLRSFKIPLIR